VSEHEKPQGRWADKLAERRAAYQERGRVYRVLFVLSGAIVTLAGIAMIVLPGPALVVIPIGLAMLAMEFAWAENALERALEHAEKASATAKEASRAQKIAATVATVLGIAAVVTWGLFADIPIVPDP
jgi:tellurite resistance protein TerC